MAQTYAQLQDLLQKLHAEAQRVRQEEIATVVARLREDIRAYELTPQDIFGKGIAKSKSAQNATAKYADGAGNAWVGRGPRPQWLRDALDAGKRLEEFLLGASKLRATPPAKKASTKQSPPMKAAARKAPAKKKPAS